MPAWKKAIDFPNPDYVTLARACGAVGFKAEKPGELHDSLRKAFKADGPAIVDCVVAADELPNVPQSGEQHQRVQSLYGNPWQLRSGLTPAK